MILVKITFLLVLLALFSASIMLPFACAALYLESLHLKLKSASPMAALYVAASGALLWLAALFQIASGLAVYWRTCLGL